MQSTLIDYRQELITSGFSDAKADALLRILDSHLATKKDLQMLKLQLMIFTGTILVAGFVVVVNYLLDIIKLLPTVD